MLAHALGVKTVFTASGQKRMERVSEMGGTVGVDYRKHDFLDAALNATERRGVDAVVDFIGAAPSLDRNLRALAPGGRLVQVGTLQRGEGQLSLDLLLHNHLRIIGTGMKSRSFSAAPMRISPPALHHGRWQVMSINVATIGDALIVQHYLTEVKERARSAAWFRYRTRSTRKDAPK
jgi:NADPH:quinone reductase-like Zn-dependent oxidoreductase